MEEKIPKKILLERMSQAEQNYRSIRWTEGAFEVEATFFSKLSPRSMGFIILVVQGLFLFYSSAVTIL